MERKSITGAPAAAVQYQKKENQANKRARHVESTAATGLSPAKVVYLSDGPISRLPNELMQSILGRLRMQKLIHLQVVCKKWRAVINSIGHTKKCLYLTDAYFGTFNGDPLKKRSFGQIDFKADFTPLILRSKFRLRPLHSQFDKLFTSVEQLIVNLPLADIIVILDLWPSSQLTTLSFISLKNDPEISSLLTRINSCTSLKRLDLVAPDTIQLLPTLAPTFARLEQFSCFLAYTPVDELSARDSRSQDDVHSFVGHFGPNCTRISLRGHHHVIESLQWHTINDQWLAIGESPIEYARSLRVLRLWQCLFVSTACPILNPHLIFRLSKLPHLAEIGIASIFLDLVHLAEAVRNYRLIPLATIRTFTISMCTYILGSIGGYNIDQFTSVLSTIMPNVEHLNINSVHYNLFGIERYLDRFPKLKTHSFNYRTY